MDKNRLAWWGEARAMAEALDAEGYCPPDATDFEGVCKKFDCEEGCISCIMDWFMERRERNGRQV